MRIYGYTLGCRLNAYETEALLEEFVERCGAERVTEPSEADLILVNSCAVTGRSTARSRKSVRQYLRNSDATVVVTGCVAQVAPDEFDQERVILIPNTDKKILVDRIGSRLGLNILPPETAPGGSVLFPAVAPKSMSRTRAFLKVQDGCDNRCTYCIVPAARGPSRSQPREVVLEHAATLARSGFMEILLTGVDLVRYGRDLYGEVGYGLPDLVSDLSDLGGFRIRLSSMEPIGLTPEILESIALPSLCRHLHIPIQSGSDDVLRRMGRNYSGNDIEALFTRCSKLFPGLSLGADVIVGFPGETEEDFSRTVELVSHPAVSYLHVFPFSPRPGTPAAEWKELALHTETVTERAEALRSLSVSARREFRKSSIGSELEILVEGRSDTLTERPIGMSDNYIPILAPFDAPEGELLTVTASEDNICWGRR